MTENILKSKSYSFATEIVKNSEQLISQKKEFILSKQLVRSGIAIGALIEKLNLHKVKQTL